MATLRTAFAVALAVAALPLPKLALPAGLVVFLSFLAAPTAPLELARKHRRALVLAAVAAAIAVPNFLVREAVPGLVEGGTRAAGAGAVSHLREILFAEDAARRQAFVDPDGDHVGSALLLGELTGQASVRGGLRLNPPLLERYPEVEVARGASFVELGGFFVMVCLPTIHGFSSDPSASFDEEQAERRFVAYAWPSGRGPGLERAYFLDEHERILSAPSADDERFGRAHPPRCDDALAAPTNEDWRPWRGKKPRAGLPGDPH